MGQGPFLGYSGIGEGVEVLALPSQKYPAVQGPLGVVCAESCGQRIDKSEREKFGKTFKYAKVLRVKYTKFNVHRAFNRLNKTKNVAD